MLGRLDRVLGTALRLSQNINFTKFVYEFLMNFSWQDNFTKYAF